MELTTYRELLAVARRHCRRAADAEDLLHEALLIALAAGRDEPAWIAGVLRNQAAMTARSAVRQRRRESAVDVPDAAPPLVIDPQPLLDRLPPSARRLAVLALHGLDADEIQWILGIAPTAFRQRLTRIRRALGELPPALRAEALALAYVRDPARGAALQFGLVRRALKAALHGAPGLGSHDPDGHLLVVRGGAHSSGCGGN